MKLITDSYVFGLLTAYYIHVCAWEISGHVCCCCFCYFCLCCCKYTRKHNAALRHFVYKYMICVYLAVHLNIRVCVVLHNSSSSNSQFKSQFIYFHIYYCVAYIRLCVMHIFAITLLARFIIFFVCLFFGVQALQI